METSGGGGGQDYTTESWGDRGGEGGGGGGRGEEENVLRVYCAVLTVLPQVHGRLRWWFPRGGKVCA